MLVDQAAYRKRWWVAVLTVSWVIVGFLTIVLQHFDVPGADVFMALLVIIPIAGMFLIGVLKEWAFLIPMVIVVLGFFLFRGLP